MLLGTLFTDSQNHSQLWKRMTTKQKRQAARRKKGAHGGLYRARASQQGLRAPQQHGLKLAVAAAVLRQERGDREQQSWDWEPGVSLPAPSVA